MICAASQHIILLRHGGLKLLKYRWTLNTCASNMVHLSLGNTDCTMLNNLYSILCIYACTSSNIPLKKPTNLKQLIIWIYNGRQVDVWILKYIMEMYTIFNSSFQTRVFTVTQVSETKNIRQLMNHLFD